MAVATFQHRAFKIGDGKDMDFNTQNLLNCGAINANSALTTAPRGITSKNTGNFANGGMIMLQHDRAAGAALQTNDSLGAVAFSGSDGAGFGEEHEGIIQVLANENFVSGTNYGTLMTFQLIKNADGYNVVTAMTLTASGGIVLQQGGQAVSFPNNGYVKKADNTAQIAFGINGNVNGCAINDTNVFFPVQKSGGAAPAYVEGGLYYDLDLHKLRVGGAAGWETLTSV